jgi:DNA-directed RNA polymerase specialized sigma24 family protein
VDATLDAARAVGAAADLPPRERAALGLWLEGASSREIARRLSFASPHAVDCCLARGRNRLRGMLLGDEAPRAA